MPGAGSDERERDLHLDPLFELLERGVLRLAFDVSAHWPRMRTLLTRYEQMDLADASVVVMSELHSRAQVLTVDRRDFSVYRRHDRRVIAVVAPPTRSR
jgi:predicted nucleic acid-binding protein